MWLSTKNLKTDRPSKKLDHKMIGPFKIIKAFGNAYTLDLPTYITIHPINKQDKYKINDILAARLFGRAKRLQFKVKWKGYPPDGAWYNADDGEFDQSQAVVDEFYRRNPKAPRSPRGRG